MCIMRKRHQLCILAMSLLLIACGGSSTKDEKVSDSSAQKEVVITVEPEATYVAGEHGKLFQVIDKKYKLMKEAASYSESYDLSFTLERTKEQGRISLNEVAPIGDDSDGTSGKSYVGKFIVEILDGNGDLLTEADVTEGDFKKLMSTAPGDKVGIKLSVYDSDKNLSKAKSFRVTFTVDKNDKKEDKKEETAVKNSTDEKSLNPAEGIQKAEKALKTAGEAAKALGELGKALQ